MSKKVQVTSKLPLEYWTDHDEAGTVIKTQPVEPDHTNELLIAIRADEGDDDPRARVLTLRPQIHFAGSPRALEAFGRYLIGVARMKNDSPYWHEHFEDVQNDDGGTLHLIVRRLRG